MNDDVTRPRPATGSHRVVLYVRQGCHLCEEARSALAPVLGDDGWSEVDIDTAPDSDRLVAAYGELVPVVSVDGVQQGFWRVDPDRVRRALAAGPR